MLWKVDGQVQKTPSTYKDNIERAIRIYLKWKVNYNE